jgi:hypothetical protein
MANTVHVKRSVATLKLPRSVPALIALARSMVTSMTSNALFTTPDPTLAAVTAATNELETAQTAAKARTHGAVAARNDKRAVLVTLLEQLKAYIQKTADANLEIAPTVIQSAGIQVRKVPAHAARVFGAKPAAVSGSVILHAVSAARRASYEWQYSTDGGKTWVQAPGTLQTKTTIAGLTPGATVTFRYRALTKTGEGDWSQAASIIVK